MNSYLVSMIELTLKNISSRKGTILDNMNTLSIRFHAENRTDRFRLLAIVLPRLDSIESVKI